MYVCNSENTFHYINQCIWLVHAQNQLQQWNLHQGLHKKSVTYYKTIGTHFKFFRYSFQLCKWSELYCTTRDLARQRFWVCIRTEKLQCWRAQTFQCLITKNLTEAWWTPHTPFCAIFLYLGNLGITHAQRKHHQHSDGHWRVVIKTFSTASHLIIWGLYIMHC
jgi:hypothetical protein